MAQERWLQEEHLKPFESTELCLLMENVIMDRHTFKAGVCTHLWLYQHYQQPTFKMADSEDNETVKTGMQFLCQTGLVLEHGCKEEKASPCVVIHYWPGLKRFCSWKEMCMLHGQLVSYTKTEKRKKNYSPFSNAQTFQATVFLCAAGEAAGLEILLRRSNPKQNPELYCLHWDENYKWTLFQLLGFICLPCI